MRSADAQRLVDNVGRARKLARLHFRRVDGGGVKRGDTQHGSIEIVKSFLHQHRSDLRTDTAKQLVFLDVNGAMSLADAGQDRFLVQRTDAAQVYDFSVD